MRKIEEILTMSGGVENPNWNKAVEIIDRIAEFSKSLKDALQELERLMDDETKADRVIWINSLNDLELYEDEVSDMINVADTLECLFKRVTDDQKK